MSASQYGHVEVVNTLLQHGASVDLKDEVHLFAVMYNKSFLPATTYSAVQRLPCMPSELVKFVSLAGAPMTLLSISTLAEP